MHCPVCQKSPREDDPGFSVELENYGMVTACRTCAERGPDPIYARHGKPGVQRTPIAFGQMSDRLAIVCGWCRRAVRQGDPGTPVRLYPEDVTPGSPHGVIIACHECMPEIHPVIQARWKLPADAYASGNMLL